MNPHCVVVFYELAYRIVSFGITLEFMLAQTLLLFNVLFQFFIEVLAGTCKYNNYGFTIFLDYGVS